MFFRKIISTQKKLVENHNRMMNTLEVLLEQVSKLQGDCNKDYQKLLEIIYFSNLKLQVKLTKEVILSALEVKVSWYITLKEYYYVFTQNNFYLFIY